MLTAGILTMSDKGSRGERVDESGRVIREMLAAIGAQAVRYEVIPDEIPVISDRLTRWADEGAVDVILTTGGTGLSARDVTPEATLAVVDRVVPGFGEAMRFKTFSITPQAILSRATAGIRKRCLIVNLPGSPKAVRECLEIVLPAIPHAVGIIKGDITEHVQ
jgi:molybdenum cofactor synthesis domain-containing protein